MTRFEFGRNWEAFAKAVGPADYQRAKASLQDLVGDLQGKTFLDVGCGSGLFSIAASGLGARQVLGFDVDPVAVRTAASLLQRACQWDPQVDKATTRFQVDSILDHRLHGQQFDVVYSWGVLHHTGQMYKAFEKILDLVRPGGVLVLAIYNRHWTSPIWGVIKVCHNRLPRILRPLLLAPILVAKCLAAIIVFRTNPFRRERGMRYYYDVVDWVGGYPYEYASIDQVVGFFADRGFSVAKVIPTKGLTGCNEFVFLRQDRPAQG